MINKVPHLILTMGHPTKQLRARTLDLMVTLTKIVLPKLVLISKHKVLVSMITQIMDRLWHKYQPSTQKDPDQSWTSSDKRISRCTTTIILLLEKPATIITSWVQTLMWTMLEVLSVTQEQIVMDIMTKNRVHDLVGFMELAHNLVRMLTCLATTLTRTTLLQTITRICLSRTPPTTKSCHPTTLTIPVTTTRILQAILKLVIQEFLQGKLVAQMRPISVMLWTWMLRHLSTMEALV